MAEERLDVLFRHLEVETRPTETFAESLYAQVEPKAMAAGRRDRSLIGRFTATFRMPTVPVPPATFRHAIVLAALLALILLVAALVGSRQPDANELVQTSVSVYLDPPPFDMTVDYETGDVRRFRFDGDATVRMDVARGTFKGLPAGLYTITDVSTDRRATLDPVSGTTVMNQLQFGLAPLHQLNMRWGANGVSDRQTLGDCSNWEYVDQVVIIGRGSHHLRCVDGRERDEEVWIDAATGLILRSTDVYLDEGRSRWTAEVSSLLLGEDVDTAALQFREDDPRWGWSIGESGPVLQAGRRVVSYFFLPPLAATPPDDGWRFWGAGNQAVGLTRSDPGHGADASAGVWMLRPQAATNVATGRDEPFPSEPDAVIEWFREHPYFEVEDVEATQVGTIPASSMTFRHVTPEGFEATCPPLPTRQGADVPTCRRWILVDGGYWTYGPSHDAGEATVLQVGDATVLIIATADGPNAEAHMTAIHELLATVEFLE